MHLETNGAAFIARGVAIISSSFYIIDITHIHTHTQYVYYIYDIYSIHILICSYVRSEAKLIMAISRSSLDSIGINVSKVHWWTSCVAAGWIDGCMDVLPSS